MCVVLVRFGEVQVMATDWCTASGAQKLKYTIERYWRDRGQDVAVELVDAGYMPAMQGSRTDVRSDMVNGLPPKATHKTVRKKTRAERIEETALCYPNWGPAKIANYLASTYGIVMSDTEVLKLLKEIRAR